MPDRPVGRFPRAGCRMPAVFGIGRYIVVMKDLASHFAFGRNWSEYAELIDTDRIDQAVRGLERLAGCSAIEGKSFLDIGCGSGLHSLSALRLGAARVVADTLGVEYCVVLERLPDGEP